MSIHSGGWRHTSRDLQRCCDREAGKRKHVYPRLVALEKMTQEKADRELAMMVAMGEYFKALADAEDAKGRLL